MLRPDPTSMLFEGKCMMKLSTKWFNWLGMCLIILIAMGLAGFTQREVILSQVVGDGYLHGEVKFEDGAPVATATATLIAQRASGADCASGYCELINAPAFFPVTKTDEHGRFSLHVPRQYLAPSGKPSFYIYKLQVELDPNRLKLFYNLKLAAHQSNHQTFTVRPSYLTRAQAMES